MFTLKQRLLLTGIFVLVVAGQINESFFGRSMLGVSATKLAFIPYLIGGIVFLSMQLRNGDLD
jgi:hypothetical protein